MGIAILSVVIATSSAAKPTVAKPETRCGWLQNPTPSNWWLDDRQGTWTLSVQGGYEASGMDNMPDMSTNGYVKTNGNYGYSCACMKVSTNKRTMQIKHVFSARPVPLRQCRSDKNLPKP